MIYWFTILHIHASICQVGTFYLVVLMDVFSIAEFIFPPSYTLKHEHQEHFPSWGSFGSDAHEIKTNRPHPVETIWATEELFDQLVICQTGDVSGAHGDLDLPSDGHGFVSGGEGFLSNWGCVLLMNVTDMWETCRFRKTDAVFFSFSVNISLLWCRCWKAV